MPIKYVKAECIVCFRKFKSKDRPRFCPYCSSSRLRIIKIKYF